MKVKYIDLIMAKEALNVVYGSDLDLLVSIDVDKNVNLINKEMEYYITAEKKLVDKYVKKNEDGSVMFDDNGNLVFIDENSANDFVSEHEKLNQKEVELDLISIRPESISEVKIKPALVKNLYFLFNEVKEV